MLYRKTDRGAHEFPSLTTEACNENQMTSCINCSCQVKTPAHYLFNRITSGEDTILKRSTTTKKIKIKNWNKSWYDGIVGYLFAKKNYMVHYRAAAAAVCARERVCETHE